MPDNIPFEIVGSSSRNICSSLWTAYGYLEYLLESGRGRSDFEIILVLVQPDRHAKKTKIMITEINSCMCEYSLIGIVIVLFNTKLHQQKVEGKFDYFFVTYVSVRPKYCSLCAKMQNVIMVLLNDQDHEKKYGFFRSVNSLWALCLVRTRKYELICFQVRSLLDISTNLET